MLYEEEYKMSMSMQCLHLGDLAGVRATENFKESPSHLPLVRFIAISTPPTKSLLF